MSWQAVIGLEIHVQLATASKIFSDCPVGFGAEPNINIDPVSTGQPGALPVLNRRAVELAVKAALALNCQIRQRSIFARKHYFYPDLPKAYQISQYDQPYAEHGWIEITVNGINRRIGITRIHLEEDAGKSIHGEAGDTFSYVDFNRAGSALIEIVSEPDMHSAAEAGAYMREVHTLIRAVGASDADLEKGNFRCDANVSIRRQGDSKLGVKTELKNINSFRFVEKAIAYEIERQMTVLEAGGTIVQETRLWDAERQKTMPMRQKEEAHDYRYFPDPDLPPLFISSNDIEQLRAELPELPPAKRKRYIHNWGLAAADAEAIANDPSLAIYFESTVQHSKDAKAAANWLINDVLAVLTGDIADFAVQPDRLGALIKLVANGVISLKIAKDVFQKMLAEPTWPQAIVERDNLAQISDSSLIETLLNAVLAAHPGEVERYKAGDKKLFGFFMGQIMAQSGGKANPNTVRTLLQQKLDG